MVVWEAVDEEVVVWEVVVWEVVDVWELDEVVVDKVVDIEALGVVLRVEVVVMLVLGADFDENVEVLVRGESVEEVDEILTDDAFSGKKEGS